MLSLPSSHVVAVITLAACVGLAIHGGRENQNWLVVSNIGVISPTSFDHQNFQLYLG